MLKYLLKNNLCCINDIFEVVEMPVGYVMRKFVEEMTNNQQNAENDIKTVKKKKKMMTYLARAAPSKSSIN